MPGVGNDQRFRSCCLQLVRRQRTVVDVLVDATPTAQPGHPHQRRHRAPCHSQPGVTLADIMQQGRSNKLASLGMSTRNEPRSAQPVALIGDRLIPEQVSLRVAVEHARHFALLTRAQRTGRQHVEKTSQKVPNLSKSSGHAMRRNKAEMIESNGWLESSARKTKAIPNRMTMPHDSMRW